MPRARVETRGRFSTGGGAKSPIFASLAEALQRARRPPDTCVVGVAMGGGFMPPDVRALLIEAAEAGPDAGQRPARAGRRRSGRSPPPPPGARRASWICAGRGRCGSCASGPATSRSVRAPRLALLGTDCAVGKRTTARLLVQACREAGLRAEMVYTGQTGWMQGGRFGFILDATPNDFVAGELEAAVVACDRAGPPGPDRHRGAIVPAQPIGALRRGAAGVGRRAGGHLAARARPRLLQGTRRLGGAFPGRGAGADPPVRGAGAGHHPERRQRDRRTRWPPSSDGLTAQLGLPVIAPLSDGVTPLLPAVRRYLRASGGRRASGWERPRPARHEHADVAPAAATAC